MMGLVAWSVYNSSIKKEKSPFYPCTTETIDCLFNCDDKHQEAMVMKLSCGVVCSFNMSKCNLSVFSSSFEKWVKGEQSSFLPQDIKIIVKQSDVSPNLDDKEAIKTYFDNLPDDLKKITYEEFLELEKQENKEDE